MPDSGLVFVLGKSGSGKSTLAKLLAEQFQHKYIDVDKVGHKVYENPDVMQKIYELYGDAINDEDGNFNRKKLGAIYFSEKGSDEVKVVQGKQRGNRRRIHRSKYAMLEYSCQKGSV